MRRERIAADQAFFAERIAGKARGMKRSRARAAALAPHLGIDLPAWRRRPQDVLIVVGSKGKGTMATFASATLATADLRVGTLTSPGLRSNRERIRVDGVAIARHEYERLVGAVSAGLETAASGLPDDGYVAPTGLFTLAALRHFADQECQVVVLEAGMGGASDEVSLVDAGVVGVGVILAEHLGILGETVLAIAEEKLGVMGDATASLVSVVQPHAGVGAAVEAAARRHGSRLRFVASAGGRTGLSPGLGAVNAAAGIAAAGELIDGRRSRPPTAAALAAALATVKLPGRLSLHRRGSQAWVIDAATNPAAIQAALAHTAEAVGEPSSVLLFVPHQRDPGPLMEALRDRPVVRVRSEPHTRVPGQGAVMHLEEIDIDRLGPRVLAIGPVYFVGELLAWLNVDCERSFTSPSRGQDARSRSTSR